jgi:hypothetical protein
MQQRLSRVSVEFSLAWLLQSAAGFSIHGGQHAAVATQGIEELGRSGVGVGESGASYAAGDAAAAASYLLAGS